jgi:hypothetical protein
MREGKRRVSPLTTHFSQKLTQPMNKSIKILSPASVANLVCGFDVLGMSLSEPADEMIMSLNHEPE